MSKYIHKVHYYETDKMGITHHSNYIRFMEEARMNYLNESGFTMARLEAAGIVSPVISLTCDYKHPTTYDDEIEIEVKLTGYTGVKILLSYVMRNVITGALVAEASSAHCFTDTAGRPVAIRKTCPEMDELLKEIEKG
ncbi:MAG: YbgC/FadM family acyl-CoA thioesterase [Clostridia bacterium]|nr:YbgC/FadM family acyl-CoA thioesterase [Clostridia bacterium]